VKAENTKLIPKGGLQPAIITIIGCPVLTTFIIKRTEITERYPITKPGTILTNSLLIFASKGIRKAANSGTAI
jgi:hypothetical protein